MYKDFLARRMLFAPDGGGTGGGGASGAGDGASGQKKDGDKEKADETLVFDTWIATQPDNVKTLLDIQERGLKSALDTERESRKDLEKQLRSMAKKAEDGSEAQTALTGMADQVAASDQKADFYEEAHRQGVSNLKLAYTIALTDDLIDSKGRMNFEKLKKDYPELFGKAKPTPKGNAGDGTDQEPPKKKGMNDFIRTASGRGS